MSATDYWWIHHSHFAIGWMDDLVLDQFLTELIDISTLLQSSFWSWACDRMMRKRSVKSQGVFVICKIISLHSNYTETQKQWHIVVDWTLDNTLQTLTKIKLHDRKWEFTRSNKEYVCVSFCHYSFLIWTLMRGTSINKMIVARGFDNL